MSEPEITRDDDDVEGHRNTARRDAPNASSTEDAAPRASNDEGDDVAGHGNVRQKA